MQRRLFAFTSRALTLAIAGFAFMSISQSAEARPAYKKVFETTYPQVKEANTISCTACHGEKSKKERNNYGQAMTKVLDETNLKDADQIAEALKKIEPQDSAVEGKTFGDLLKDGKLPAAE